MARILNAHTWARWRGYLSFKDALASGADF